MQRESNIARRKELDQKKHDDLVSLLERKDANTKNVLQKLSEQDPRAIFRESSENKVINKKLYGGKYYFIPERYREALLKEFYNTYEGEATKVEIEGKGHLSDYPEILSKKA